MFDKLKKKDKTELAREIEVRIANLSMTSGDVDEDAKAVDTLKKLTEIEAEREKPKNPLNPNTIVSGMFMVGTALLMLNYEKDNVITSKVLGIIPKMKL